MAQPRSRSQRRSDALAKLRDQVDLWVASAGDAGAYLIPLSWARVALGPTRDVLIIEGTVEAIPIGVDPEREDAHAATTGFDPRTLSTEYTYLRITPQEIQAWREANELPGRQLMKEGAWLE